MGKDWYEALEGEFGKSYFKGVRVQRVFPDELLIWHHANRSRIFSSRRRVKSALFTLPVSYNTLSFEWLYLRAVH